MGHPESRKGEQMWATRHSVLWALERLGGPGHLQGSIGQMKVRFQKLIYVGGTVSLIVVHQDACRYYCMMELLVVVSKLRTLSFSRIQSLVGVSTYKRLRTLIATESAT